MLVDLALYKAEVVTKLVCQECLFGTQLQQNQRKLVLPVQNNTSEQMNRFVGQCDNSGRELGCYHVT